MKEKTKDNIFTCAVVFLPLWLGLGVLAWAIVHEALYGPLPTPSSRITALEKQVSELKAAKASEPR